MKIVLIVDAGRGFRWQDELGNRLERAGHTVAWRRVSGGPCWPTGVALVAEIERLIYRLGGPGYATPGSRPRSAAGVTEEGADLSFDLSGRDLASIVPATDDPAVFIPLYDGLPDPAAAVAALLDSRAPRLEIVRRGRVIVSGLPANERPDVLAAGLDFVFARVVDLCCGAVAGLDEEPARPSAANPARLAPQPAIFALATLTAKLGARLTRRLREPEAWRIGWRRQDPSSILDDAPLPADGFTWLPDDGRRYFADPFLHVHRGRLWGFCEEYPYTTRRGVISAFEIRPDGTPGTPRVVLETGSHLSYPFVFEEAGEIWMIPESQAAGDLALYRALDFPWMWQRERTLLDGVLVSDATPLHHEGRLWLFAGLQEQCASGEAAGAVSGSSWDALGLFHAPSLFGDFAAHPGNPVLIDAGASRPAGRPWRRGSGLMRVAQDCRCCYGAGLAICRVDRLDPEGYRQTTERFVAPPPAWGASGLHTMDAAGGFEIVDCLRRRPG